MNSQISVLLSEYGLNGKEIIIYTKLVENERLTAYALAKQSRIHRSTTYDILARLIRNGFVGTIQEDKTNYYFASSPNKLMTDLKSKEAILQKITQELKTTKSISRTKVQYLEGLDSQKQFNIDSFEQIKNGTIKEALVLGNGPSWTLGSELLVDNIIKELKHMPSRFRYRAIWDPKFRGKKISEKYKDLGEQRYLRLPSETTILISDETVAFLFTTDSPRVIRIQEKKIADEMRVYFEYLWNIAKK